MRLRARHLLLLAAVPLLLAIPSGPVFGSQGCGIGVAVHTPVVNLPSDRLPPPSTFNFAEIVDVNYTTSFLNQTIALQYMNGSRWAELQSFLGNPVGFTETGLALDARWAKFGTNTIRAASSGCTSGTAAFVVQSDPSGPESDLGIYAGIAAALATFVVLGMKLGWKKFVLIAAAAYLVISPWTGQRYDIYFLASSGIRFLQHVNPFDPGTPPLYPSPLKWAYPPLYPIYGALSFLVFQGVTGAGLPSVNALTYPGWYTSVYSIYQAYVPSSLPVLVFLLKVPMVAAAVTTGFLLKKMSGRDSHAVWWVANPLVILVTAVWGEFDPIPAFLTVASLFYFEKGREYYAYLLSSLGAAFKVWPALVIPIFLIVSLRKNGFGGLKPLLAVVPAILVSLGVYALYESPIQSLYLLAYARGIPTFAGAFTVNGLTWQEFLFVLRSPPVPVFLFVGLPLYAAILGWAYWRRETDTTKMLTVFLLIFYLTYNYVNPQYFYWILPLLILKGRRMATVVFTALPLAYIALSYNIFYFVSPAVLPDEFRFGASVVDQLKVSYFYNSPVLFVLVAGIVPTFAYLWLLRETVKANPTRMSPVKSSEPSLLGVPLKDSEDILNKAH